ncbi:MAG: spore germination protein [Oscillospiraceae bacterium]|nr:spore germination protein [Oscillibacter sp.]MDY5018179.1 spore germination protein [Oscillospiraceae bacterium]
MDCLTADFEENVRTLDALLGVGRCFDMISRDLYVGGKRARLWVVDGYGDDAVIERMLSFWLPLRNIDGAQTMQQFIDRYITFSEVNAEQSVETAVTSVFLGKLLLLIDGFDACALIDAKQFPARSVEEPSAGKVLRGAHDGFIETLVANAALLRRRIRDPQLTLEGHKVSDCSRADVVLCYLENKVDRKLLDEVRQKLAKIDVRSVSMSQESIAEAMMEKKQWWTPFPKVRYTERPDAATACVMEGNIVVLVDNSPAAMILPTHFFDFVQEANDYYFPPLIGTYLRVLRIVVFLLTMFITPVWYLLVKDPARTQAGLEFLAIESDYSVPLLVQLLLAEFIVDLLKLASLNTPAVFSNSFSMLGALVLGDFAVQAHWLVPEVLAYMAFVAISNFAQPSYELGYAFKLLRIVLLLFVGALDWVGLALGCIGIIALLALTKPIVGEGYLYPLCPLNKKALFALFVRRPISRDNT